MKSVRWMQVEVASFFKPSKSLSELVDAAYQALVDKRMNESLE
jgi:hypothetical protein